MDKLIAYIKQHTFVIIVFFLILIGAYIFFQKNVVQPFAPSFASRSMGLTAPAAPLGMGGMAYNKEMASDMIVQEDSYAPQPSVGNRLVIQNSYLSLLVKNVKETKDNILRYVHDNGGYMVSSDSNENLESPSATITVRVPAENLEQVLTTFRSYALRVVSEHLDGRDVTDQYVDIEKRIAILQKTIDQYEALRSQSKEISDLTQLTREILNTQSQIDSLKGQQESLENNAQMTKLTVYLSIDEIALPYQPDDNFRPSVVFKLAVRSLMTSLRSGLSTLIWIGVYGVIWIPLLLIVGTLVFIITRKKK